jgi:hypothetical protein
VASAFAVATLAAQQPQTAPQPQPRPATPETRGAQATPSTTVVGCVYREKDVPGRAPNVAERVGILEDYILVETSAFTGATATGGASTSGATSSSGAGRPGAAATSGASGAMYKLEFADDDRLQALVGKRVEAVGRVDAESGDSPAAAPGTKTTTTDKVIGRDRVDLAEFEITSIKEVAGSCPAMPAAR